MGWEDEVKEIKRRQEMAKQMGGPENVARHHQSGKLTVRERIDQMLDSGSFREIAALTGAAKYDEQGNLIHFTPANIVIGTGRINQRRVVVSGEDFTIRVGSSEATVSEKWIWAERLAAEIQIPIVRLIDAVGDTEEQCMDIAKRFLSYLPSNAKQLPPKVDVPEGSGKDMDRILDLLPEQSSKTYDMKKIIRVIVDGGEFLELKPLYARPCITALTRLDGRSIGVIANNPYYGAGALTADCCDKITSFLVLCDSYNIPIFMLVDTPGFMIGKEGEYKKVTGKIINWMNALSLFTVPILTVVIGKTYGQAYLNMGAGKYSSVFVAWPTAQISFMGLEPGINVVFNVKKEDNPERYKELLGQMGKDTEPYDAAGIFGLTDIIQPAETREYLIRMLNLHYNRLTGGIGRHLLHNWPTSY